jgi:hypothetical protein
MNDKPISGSSSPKVFDVSPPNQTTASPTSRPIITSKQELQPDPMVKATPQLTVAQKSSKAAKPELAEITPPEVQPVEEPTPTEMPPTEGASAAIEEKTAEPVAAGVAMPDNQPINEPAPEVPQITKQKMVVSHHKGKKSGLWSVLIILLALVVLIIVVDLLFDVGIIKSTVPHTHFFGN